MRHVIAFFGFLAVLCLFVSQWFLSPQPGGDGLVVFWVALYGVLAILMLAIYHALFRASTFAIFGAVTLSAVAAILWKLHWIGWLEGSEVSGLAAAIATHHLILRGLGAASPQGENT